MITTTTPDTTTTIRVGDIVRSFDFSYCTDLEGERACFVRGMVEAILPAGETHDTGAVFHDCDRYVIRCTRRVQAGQDYTPEEIGRCFFPPINGLAQLFSSSTTNGVQRVTGVDLA